jgi:hypothetical protein
MPGFCRRAAAETIAALTLEDASRALAEHWLSLWPGDRLPPRAALHPGRLKAFLPNIVLFNVVPDVSVRVRLSGTHVDHIMGAALAGADWIALAGPARAAIRLAMFGTIARGAMLVDHRLAAMAVGEPAVVEEIILPFAADTDGVSLVMAHVNLSPAQYLKVARVKNVLSEPLDHQVVRLAGVAAVAA